MITVPADSRGPVGRETPFPLPLLAGLPSRPHVNLSLPEFEDTVRLRHDPHRGYVGRLDIPTGEV